MKKISAIWTIFGILFILLGIFHLIQCTKTINEFEMHERPSSNLGKITILGSDIDQPIKSFSLEINGYIEQLNKSNRTINILAAIGYFIAAATAFFSLIIIK